MAKDKFTLNTTTEIVGMLDKNDNNELMVWIDRGKDLPMGTVNIIDLLENSTGRQIVLKLSSEKDLMNE